MKTSNPLLGLPAAGGGPADLPLSGMAAGGSASIPLLRGDSMPNLIVPPGGFAGFAQQTAATQALFQRAGRIGGMRSASKRRRKRKASNAGASKKRRRTSSRRKQKLVKGSAAAKRFMANLRKRRKRK